MLSALILGTVGVASAATVLNNPYNDVPISHWSYDAVNTLTKAGVIEGYGDNAFRGEKSITRYEMAVIVAKALARQDKADTAQKAMIDKLAAEYKTDLEGIGVRLKDVEEQVKKIDEKASVINFQGSYFGWRSMRANNGLWPVNAAHVDLIENFKVDDTTTITLEQEYQGVYKKGTDAWSGGEMNTTNTKFGQMFVQTVLGDKTKVKVGRFGNRAAYGMTYIGNINGAKLSFDASDKLKANVAFGQVWTDSRYSLYKVFYAKSAADYAYANLIESRMPYASVDFDYAVSRNTNVKASYQRTSDCNTIPGANYYEVGADTKVGHDFTLTAVGVKSSRENDNKGYFGQLLYKKAMFWAVPHSYDVFANYRKTPNNTIIGGYGGNPSDFYGDDNNSINFKGTTIGFHYVPKRMQMLTVFYMNGKTVDDNTNKSIFRGQYDFFL